MEKRPTIEDVAKLANVSTATVSHVINETRYVSESTRQSVLDAIEQLNYRPSALAKGLASNRTCLVGVVLSDINNPLFRNVYIRIESELSEAGYDLILANTGEDIARQNSILEALFSRQVDGLIVAPNHGTGGKSNPLKNAGVPVVVIDRFSEEKRLPTITVNNEEITYQAISHLISDGHQRIGFVGGLMDKYGGVSTVTERLKGFRRAMQQNHLPVLEEHIHVLGKACQSDGYQAGMRILGTDRRPAALFTTNILLLLGVLQAMQELNLRCPEDVGIISFDHDHWTDVYVPPISLVKQPTDAIGIAAARQLIRLMGGEEQVEEIEQVLPCELIIRGSCSPQCFHEFLQRQNRSLPWG
ncbi:MAG TPA: LacI family DNA-binding transcriptional regulator [Aggregatilineaceae bacterium]|nr:LacI family DNA-binding transcriptional regulator [Aggregatilineaceae bacterium]